MAEKTCVRQFGTVPFGTGLVRVEDDGAVIGLAESGAFGEQLLESADADAALALLGLDPIATPLWEKVASHTYVDFSIAAPSRQIALGTPVQELLARQGVEGCVVKVTTKFDGPGLGSATLDVGVAGNDGWIIAGVDGFVVPGDAVFDSVSGLWIAKMAGTATGLKITLTADVNLNTLNQGSVEVWLKKVRLPA